MHLCTKPFLIYIHEQSLPSRKLLIHDAKGTQSISCECTNTCRLFRRRISPLGSYTMPNHTPNNRGKRKCDQYLVYWCSLVIPFRRSSFPRRYEHRSAHLGHRRFGIPPRVVRLKPPREGSASKCNPSTPALAHRSIRA